MNIPPSWIAFAFIAVVFLGIALQKRLRAQAHERLFDACRSLAQRRGLTFELMGKKRGQPQHFRFSNPAQGLTLTIKGGKAKRRKSGSTLMHLQAPTFDGGLAIYSSQRHPQLATAIATFSGILDNPLARRTLGKLLGDDLAGNLGQLQAFPAPGGVVLSVLADTDPHRRFDPLAIARTIEDGPRDHRGEPQTMIVLRGIGMDLRVAFALLDVNEIERFLDQGLALQADLLSRQGGLLRALEKGAR